MNMSKGDVERGVVGRVALTKLIAMQRINLPDDIEPLAYLCWVAARIYNKTVSLIRKVHKKKGFWLSKGSIQKYLRLKGYSGSTSFNSFILSIMNLNISRKVKISIPNSADCNEGESFYLDNR